MRKKNVVMVVMGMFAVLMFVGPAFGAILSGDYLVREATLSGIPDAENPLLNIHWVMTEWSPDDGVPPEGSDSVAIIIGDLYNPEINAGFFVYEPELYGNPLTSGVITQYNIENNFTYSNLFYRVYPGDLIFLREITDGDPIYGVAYVNAIYQVDNSYYGLMDVSYLIQDDPTLGANFVPNLRDIVPHAVPAPAAVWVFMSGLLGLSLIRKKRV